MLRRSRAPGDALAARLACGALLLGTLAVQAGCEKAPREGREGDGVRPSTTLAAEAGGSRTEGHLSTAPPTMSAAPAAGDVDAIVRAALSAGTTAGRTLVVYVGATWCEPCQHFHHAVEDGELGQALAGITFLEFDLDRDKDRLMAAGYRSAYIPLFALPGEDGRASGRQVEGGIKGDGAVGFMLPRLQGLLGR